MSLHSIRPGLVVVDKTGEEPPEMAVAVGSRAAGMKGYCRCPATCRSVTVVVAVSSVVGVSVGGVVSQNVLDRQP